MYNAIAPVLMLDIWNHLTPDDKEYFRTTREMRFGSTLENVSSICNLATLLEYMVIKTIRVRMYQHNSSISIVASA